MARHNDCFSGPDPLVSSRAMATDHPRGSCTCALRLSWQKSARSGSCLSDLCVPTLWYDHRSVSRQRRVLQQILPINKVRYGLQNRPCWLHRRGARLCKDSTNSVKLPMSPKFAPPSQTKDWTNHYDDGNPEPGKILMSIGHDVAGSTPQ
jgi:hypothetical protein